MPVQDIQNLFLRDAIKKKHGFLRGRRRKLSYTDAKLSETFDKLKGLLRQQIVARFRIVFGSDIIELRLMNNPFIPVTFRTDAFLAADFSQGMPIPIDQDDRIPNDRIPAILFHMKELRDKERKFLEAFRINSVANNVWVYFSSAKSLFGNYQSFLHYAGLRSEQDLLNAELETLLSFPGDEFESLVELVTHEEPSAADEHIDAINAKTAHLFAEQRIFEFQIYHGSGLVRVITNEEPHQPQHLSVEQYLDDEMLGRSRSISPSELARGCSPDRDFRMQPDRCSSILSLVRKLREGDDELYLRVFYMDALNDRVVVSFSCGGTYCMSGSEFLESGFSRENG